MRNTNEDGQFEDTCQGCDDCDCEEAEVLPSFPETVVVIPEIEGEPYAGMSLSKKSKKILSDELMADRVFLELDTHKNLGQSFDNFLSEEGIEVKEFSNAFAKQIGGDHYKDLVIQPTEFIMKNKLNFLEGCIIKRICRYKKKGFPLQDLRKVQHEIDMIIELEGY